jgi:Tfp pilus assembly protein PilN
MIQPALDRLVVEIQRSFTYHQERTGSPPPTQLILSGGTAQLPNLGPHLAERLEIDVEVHDPFARLDLPEQVRKGIVGVAPQMAIAAGLALEQARTLNLLPPHIAAARRATWARLGIRAAAVAAALVTVGAYGMTRQARTEAERALAARRSSLADLQPVLEVAKRLQGRRDALAPVLRAYDTLLAGGTPWHGILKELSNLTPRAVTLNELVTMPKGRIKIKGIAFANGASAEMVLADYLGRLESSPFFSGVDLIVSREREDFDVRALDFEATSGIP